MAVKGQTGSAAPARSQCETPEIMRSARRALPHPRVSGPRPNVIDHVSVTTFERIRIQPAGKTGDTRPAFQSARKSFVLRKSCNTFGDRHRACVNCPTNLRSGSHSAPPPPSPSRRTRSARRPRRDLIPATAPTSENETEGTPAHREDSTAGTMEPSKRTTAERWPRTPPSGRSRFFTATRVETTRRSRNSKALGHLHPENPPGQPTDPGIQDTKGIPAPPSFLIPRRREAFPNDVETREPSSAGFTAAHSGAKIKE
jgi:hypothetical protein